MPLGVSQNGSPLKIVDFLLVSLRQRGVLIFRETLVRVFLEADRQVRRAFGPLISLSMLVREGKKARKQRRATKKHKRSAERAANISRCEATGRAAKSKLVFLKISRALWLVVSLFPFTLPMVGWLVVSLCHDHSAWVQTPRARDVPFCYHNNFIFETLTDVTRGVDALRSWPM